MHDKEQVKGFQYYTTKEWGSKFPAWDIICGSKSLKLEE